MEDLSCEGASAAPVAPQALEGACGDEGLREGACTVAGKADEERGGALRASSSANDATTPSEDLLYSWLRFNLAIRTERVLKGFPFREVLVYSCLHRLRRDDPTRKVSATELCDLLGIKKPQMATLLARMEEKGLIDRVRSDQDRRVVHVLLTGASLPLYEEEHRRIMEVVDTIASRYGVDRLGEVIRMFDELSAIAEEVIR